MRPRTLAIAAAAVFGLAFASGGPARAEAALTVCLDENVPPYSSHRGVTASGFDLAVAQKVAERVERPLAVQWFESKIDEDSSVLAANALLSDGRCQLVAGYPLIREALGKPGAASARLPDYEGAMPADRRRRVALGTLVPSRPYHYAPLTVVLSPAAALDHVNSLGDLDGVRLVVEGGTLADAILMTYRDGRLVNRITHLVPGRGELLKRLESGNEDATLIALHRFDAYRLEHPDTKLRLSGFYYRIGFNMGFAALSTEQALVEQVDRAIDEMTAKGEFAVLARAAGMTYLPPHSPDILEGIPMGDLSGD